MRAELANTQSLRLAHNSGTVRPQVGQGAQGLPGPGSAAWTALQAVTTGSVRQAPDGSWIKSVSNRTTGASFDATEEGFWTPVLGTAGTIEEVALAHTFARGISLTQPEFGAVLGTTATHQVAFEDALVEADTLKTFLHVPAGTWIVDGLNWPSRVGLKGEGHRDTKLQRNTDQPIIQQLGAPYNGDGTWGAGLTFPSHYGSLFEDVSFYSALSGDSTPLVKLYGTAGNYFNRVEFECYHDGPPLLEGAQMWDTKFDNCMFHGGGSDTGNLGAVRLMAGLTNGADTYRQTKECFFNNCWWESYYGPGIEMGRPGGYTTTKTEMLHFSNIKMESPITTKSHVLATAANHLKLSNFYITHKLTTGPIMDLVNVHGLRGAVGFTLISGGTAPSELVRKRTDAYLIDLAVIVSEPHGASDNVLTIDDTADVTSNLQVIAPYVRVNGNTIPGLRQMGRYWLWVDPYGVLRRKSTPPTSTADGAAIVDRENVSSASLSAIGNAINTANKYQGKQVYCTSVAKFLHTNGATAGSVWLNPDGTTAFTPV